MGGDSKVLCEDDEANAWTTTVVGHMARSRRLFSGEVFMMMLRDADYCLLDGSGDIIIGVAEERSQKAQSVKIASTR